MIFQWFSHWNGYNFEFSARWRDEASDALLAGWVIWDPPWSMTAIAAIGSYVILRPLTSWMILTDTCMLSALMGTRTWHLLALRMEPSSSFAHFSCHVLRILRRLSRGCWESFKQKCGFNYRKKDASMMIWFWYFLQFGGSTTRNDEHWRTSVAVMYWATWRWALRLWLKTSDFSRDEKTTSLMWKLGYSRVLIHCHLFSRLMQWCRLKPQKWACSRGSGMSPHDNAPPKITEKRMIQLVAVVVVLATAWNVRFRDFNLIR